MGHTNEIISTPNGDNKTSHENKDFGFGLHEIKGWRDSQEDAAAVRWYDKQFFDALTPEEIGRRLWTTYKVLNSECLQPKFGGSTASTTVYDGKGNLITATLGDSLAFLVVYEEGKDPVVTRLNQVIHHPEEDKQRFLDAGGTIIYGRAQGRGQSSLSMARAMGDLDYHGIGLCDDAHINSTPIAGITGKIQIITTCDGFTESLSEQTKTAHEQWLLDCLKKGSQVEQWSEFSVASMLVTEALLDESKDNISIAVQTLSASQPFLIGIYDGHAGISTSTYVAKHIGTVFEKQCQLSAAEYAQQPFSANRHSKIYCRDNEDVTLSTQYQVEQEIRAGELSVLDEPIRVFKEFRSQLITAAAMEDEEEIKDPLKYLVAMEQLILFIETMHGFYSELTIDKQELIDCMKYVLNSESAFIFDKEYFKFLDLDFKGLREVAAEFHEQEVLKDIPTNLLQIYLALEETQLVKNTGRHRFFNEAGSSSEKDAAHVASKGNSL